MAFSGLSVALQTMHSSQRQDTPLHWASRNGHAECCTALLEGKADVNAKNKVRNMGRGISDFASVASAPGCVVLIDHLRSVPQGSWTPLHLASEHGRGECVKLLCGAGADRNAQAIVRAAAPITRQINRQPCAARSLSAFDVIYELMERWTW